VGFSLFHSLINKTLNQQTTAINVLYVSHEIIAKVPFKQDLTAFIPPFDRHKKLEKKWG
jgi:hypothetical protein